MQTYANYVVIAALVMAGVSFLVYLVLSFTAARPKPGPDVHAAASAALVKAEAAPVEDFTDLLKALTAFYDSLSKAGPALSSMMAAIFFLAIAAYASAPGGDKPPPGGQTVQPKAAPAPSR